MRYNILISTFYSTYNILAIDEESLAKVIDSYNKGAETFYLEGTKQTFKRLNKIRVFTFEEDFKNGNDFLEFAKSQNLVAKGYMNMYSCIDEKGLAKFGEDVTKNFIKNDFGHEQEITNKALNITDYVNSERIKELENLSITGFDLTKLIGLCYELNAANANGMYLAIPMLIRAMIDHIPPLFGKPTFLDMAGSYGSRSFQELMTKLEKSSRKIADSYLHQPIRNKEVMPNETQVNFKSEIDVLLGEIVRVYKKTTANSSFKK